MRSFRLQPVFAILLPFLIGNGAAEFGFHHILAAPPPVVGAPSRPVSPTAPTYWEAAARSLTTTGSIPYHGPAGAPAAPGYVAPPSRPGQPASSGSPAVPYRVDRPLDATVSPPGAREPIAEIKRPHPSVARLVLFDRDGQRFGSGTLIGESGDYGIVLTNWHVVSGADGLAHIHFPNSFGSYGAVIAVDQKWDLAAVAISKPSPNGVPRLPVARTVPRPGDSLWIVGYGAGTYRMANGRCVRYLAPEIAENGTGEYELIDLSVSAREGDSGGPILNADGELAGVLFGSDYRNTVGSNCTKVRQFLALVEPIFAQLPSNPEELFGSIEPEGPRRQLVDSARMHAVVRDSQSRLTTGTGAQPGAASTSTFGIPVGNARRAARAVEQSAVYREPVQTDGRKAPIRQQSYDEPYREGEGGPVVRAASVLKERYSVGTDPDLRTSAESGSLSTGLKPLSFFPDGSLPADREAVSQAAGEAGHTTAGNELRDARPHLAGWIFALVVTAPILISVLRRQASVSAS